MNASVPETEPASEAIRPANQNESAGECDLPKINVSAFETIFPNRVCIARSIPASLALEIPHLKALAPSPELLQQWQDSNKSDYAWKQYTYRYWGEIKSYIGRRRSVEVAALDQDSITGRPIFSRCKCIVFVLKHAARVLRVDELTLCCWEPSKDDHCHRKLIYDVLPEEMKGFRM